MQGRGGGGGGGGALMAARGKLPSYMIILVCVFAVIALIGFHTLKECRTVAALFLAKENEIERLNNQHEKDAADLKKMSSILKENDKFRRELESKLEDAEASAEHSRKHLAICQQGRQKCVDREAQSDAKDDEMLSLQQKLQEKDSEISAIKMRLATQDVNKETTAKNTPELEQTEQKTDNPEERRSDGSVEGTDGKHQEEEESTMTAEDREKDADKGTEESSETAAAAAAGATTSETEEHESKSLKKLEDQSVDNEETVDDRGEVQEDNNANSKDQTEAEDSNHDDTDLNITETKPTETNGSEEKTEVDAKQRDDTESET